MAAGLRLLGDGVRPAHRIANRSECARQELRSAATVRQAPVSVARMTALRLRLDAGGSVMEGAYDRGDTAISRRAVVKALGGLAGSAFAAGDLFAQQRA